MLREKYPGINFEVINTAMPAVNSHVVLEIIKDCAKHKGDLFIVYLGNNEVIGPYGAGTVFAPLSSSLSFIRFDKALKTVRLGQLLTNILQRRAQRDLPKIWGGNRMFMENLIRATNPDLQIVYQHYQRNLEDIGRIARKSGAKIIFSTVGSNLKDCPPFASLYQPDMTESDEKKWNDIYQQAIACETAGKYTDAVRHYLAAAEIDDSYAELQFRLGRCYWAMKEYDKAREKYIQARELDALRLRADNQINNIIRSVAGDKTAEGVYLVDAVKVTEKNSPHDIPGEKLFYEHVHYNFNGNYLLAGTVFEQVEQILPDWIKAHKTNKPLVTSQECEQHLAYTDWDRLQIAYYILNSFTKKTPFTSRLDNKKLVERMAKEAKALETYRAQESLKKSAAQYRQAIRMWPGDWQLHWKYGQLLFIDLKNHRAAAEQFRLVNKYCPHSYFGYTALGEASATLGDFDGAVAGLLEAARIKPTHFGAYFRLASLYKHLGKIDKAREYYAKTLKYHPGHVPACANLATILFNQGKIVEAEQTIRQGKIYAPQSLDLNYYLGIMFERQGRTREAIEEFRTILQRDPNSTKARNKLNALLKKANEI